MECWLEKYLIYCKIANDLNCNLKMLLRVDIAKNKYLK